MGYIMLAVSMIIIIYGSLSARASSLQNTDTTHDPFCFFNPLCSCSKAYPDLGVVTCRDIALPRIPPPINSSKVYKLHLENNGLRHIDPHFLQDTGLYRIEISWNSLTEITPEAFNGLERSLWELDLHHNRLTTVPSRSFRYLQKLKLLDLGGNEITDIAGENWRGLEDSLETLILKNNGIAMLPPGVFSPLQNLHHLDLSGNSILEIEDNVFREGPFRLYRLNLADNILFDIPYHPLSYLKQLRHLDLSLNRIAQMHGSGDQDNKRGTSLSLDTLHLDYNQLHFLPPGAFRNFMSLNQTYLNGNTISVIQENAFQGSRIKELYLYDCGISELTAGAFAGLEKSLQLLDLGGNNLTVLPHRLFHAFDFLRTLSLKDNFLPGINPGEAFNGFQFSLYSLDMSGQENAKTALQDLRRMRNIRSLSLSRLPQPNLSPDDFQEFGIDLEDLKISNGKLKGLKNHAFKHVRGLKRLDLSENSISTVENDAFAEVGHSINYLNLAFGFASSFSKMPNEAFKHLTSIEHLDLSNNKLKNLPENSFHFMNHLEILQLEDNSFESIPKGVFQGDIHTSLQEIHLSFNHISQITSQTFFELKHLHTLWLDDNKITRVEKQGFMSLDKLRYLDLKGNKINFISHEAFQDLPELEKLDLAYNKLKDFDFGCLDQVGTLSSFNLNVSHNEMKRLNTNVSTTYGSRLTGVTHVTHANVKILDFSYNNITFIGRWYFRPVESSITHLFLAHNQLTNLTKDMFGNMQHLQWVDLSNNHLEELEFDSFRNTRRLQVLYLSNNRLLDIPDELFRGLSNIRVVEMAWNRLRSLPDILFTGGGIEKLDVSGNQLSRMPFTSFSVDAAESLVELDISYNGISALHSPDQFGRFRNLQILNLSNNRLLRLEDGAFSYLPRLYSLDLSHNIDIILDIRGRTFLGLEDSLEDLFLRNLSLIAIPEMHLPTLKWLDLTDNQISAVAPELSQNLSSLRKLELSGNYLTTIPPGVITLTQLRSLGVARNRIQTINIPQGSKLRELDIRQLPLNFFEVAVMGKMSFLQTLRLSPFLEIRDLNLPHILQNNHALEHLHIDVHTNENPTIGDEMMKGLFPAKLRNITLTGRGLKTLSDALLQGIRNPNLNFAVHNTSLERIPKSIFQRARYVRNVTIDVRSNKLKSLGNPCTGILPNMPRKTFLMSLKIADNKWTCDCDLGWIEGWERKKRQLLCETGFGKCLHTEDDLRMATCDNKKQNSVIEVLKSDIECGWGHAGTFHPQPLLAAVMSVFALTWGRNLISRN